MKVSKRSVFKVPNKNTSGESLRHLCVLENPNKRGLRGSLRQSRLFDYSHEKSIHSQVVSDSCVSARFLIRKSFIWIQSQTSPSP